MAHTLPGILPKMLINEAIDVAHIYTLANHLPPEAPLLHRPPFRSLHHTISHAWLVVGGNWLHTGEIQLVNHGVLFTHGLPKFGKRVPEVLRQPLEDKVIIINRAQGLLTFPVSFQLVGAVNP